MEDQLREHHFLKLARLMEDHTGIQLPPSKRSMIEGRLRKRVRALDLSGLADYGQALFDGGLLDEEFPYLVACVTTNKTDFFREPDHFVFLRNQAIPALLARRGRSNADLKIWSAAASTGAEIYTIAMILSAMQESGHCFRFSLLGTDISLDVLEQARRAIFPRVMLDAVPEDLRRRYVMQPADAQRDEMRIVPELRRLVRFEHLNLTDKAYPFERDIDVIFCRNVLIYFSKATQQAVLANLISHLRPGGFLILGHSESFAFEDKATMAQISPTVFQRPDKTRVIGRVA